MKLVLFRHGERENNGSSNPPLSPRGVSQSQHLWQLVLNKKLPGPHRLLCSPKLRARMTLAKVAENLDLPLQIMSDLDERTTSESITHFSRRVQKVLSAQSLAPGVVFLCTHLDWLEIAMCEIPCDTDLTHDRYHTSWVPGHYMVFDVYPELWHFEKMETLPS